MYDRELPQDETALRTVTSDLQRHGAVLAIPRVAAQIKGLRHQRDIVAGEVEKLVDDFPLSQVSEACAAWRTGRWTG